MKQIDEQIKKIGDRVAELDSKILGCEEELGEMAELLDEAEDQGDLDHLKNLKVSIYERISAYQKQKEDLSERKALLTYKKNEILGLDSKTTAKDKKEIVAGEVEIP